MTEIYLIAWQIEKVKLGLKKKIQTTEITASVHFKPGEKQIKTHMPGGVIVGDSGLCCCGPAFNV